MLPLTQQHSLLDDIKAAIAGVIPNINQAASTGLITDANRLDCLNQLMTFSDKIPHPASTKDVDNGDKGSNGDKGGNSNKTDSQTLIRWQILAYVAGIDLTIAKWFESHLDALSILHEVGYRGVSEGLWAVWASEGPPLTYDSGKLNGTKAWCSGANMVKHGLLTYRDSDGHSQLLIVDMQQEGIEIDNSSWQAVGMQSTDTSTIQFSQVTANPVGAANAYLERAGFWHGAAGVAACWYGATATIAAYLITSYQQKPNDYKAMYLGQISTALAVTQQYFYHVADLIDSEPQLSHELAIRQLRVNVERLARQVLDTVGQALGAAPFCRDAHFARLSADLPVFIRQSHAAFDLQKIGELTSNLASQATIEMATLTDEQENLWQL